MSNEISEIDKAEELNNLLTQFSVENVERFFQDHKKCIKDILEWTSDDCFLKIISPNIIEILSLNYVRLICKYMTGDFLRIFSMDSNNFFASDQICSCVNIITSKKICHEKKALIWHVLSRISFEHHAAKSIYMQAAEQVPIDIVLDKTQARKILFITIKDDEKCIFIRNTISGIDKEKYGRYGDIRHFNPNDKMHRAINNDHVALFEMTRQIYCKNIAISMLLYLLHHKAVKCFLYLLTHFRKQVYKSRTETEWLFTVCRHFGAETAIPIIKQIEMDSPGIVASARDPWGNTLLWHTLSNRHNTQKIQDILVELRCNPDAVNQWGLSFRLVKENPL